MPTETGRTRRAACVATAALALAGGARAESQPYYIGVSETFTQDSNLLGLGDDRAAPPGSSRDDRVRTDSLVAGFDQGLGRQRAYGSLTLRNLHYDHNSIYDNRSYNANAGLDWSTVSRVSGTLGASSNRGLYAFDVGYTAGLLTEPNLQQTDSLNASVAVGLVTEYSLVLNAGTQRVSNSLQQATAQALNFEQDNASVGLQWRPREAITLAATVSGMNGRYPAFQQTATGVLEDRFQQSGIDFSAILQPAGSSNLEAHLGYSRTRYDLNQQRDFSGLTGRLVWTWQATGRTLLSTQLARDVGQNGTALTLYGIPGTANYSQVSSTARLQLDRDMGSKFSLTAAAQAVQRTLVDTIIDPAFSYTVIGRDHTVSLSAGVRWRPRRSLLFGCDYNELARSASGLFTLPMHDRNLACFAQVEVQG